MAMTIEALDTLFDDHPSLDASLQDFESDGSEISLSPRFHYPSHQSGILSDTTSEIEASVSGGRFSPPAWRRDGDGNRSSGFWNRGAGGLGTPSWNSRDSSPERDIADSGQDATLAAAARTRLPTGSLSPERQRSPIPGLHPGSSLGDLDISNPLREMIRHDGGELAMTETEDQATYFRLTLNTELRQKIAPFEAVFLLFKKCYGIAARPWSFFIASALGGLFLSIVLGILSQPESPLPGPDLIKVAGLASAFEPFIFYSENGAQQVGELQASGYAVWDLGETVRYTNMASAPAIVDNLVGLSETLGTLTVELIRFFSNVDGDVDGILIVMDWAKRELAQVRTLPSTPLGSVFDNFHSVFRRCGLLETPAGAPTPLGKLATSIFGLSTPQRTRQTLQRTFTHFLSVLEAAIDSELQQSLALLALFESADKLFRNLASTVIQESSEQESAQDDMLSSLWTKLLGPNASTLRKFEKNKKLLSNVHAKTVQDKGALLDYNSRLLTLKSNLENLRGKLVSPLVRANASTLGIEEQINGLEEVRGHLGGLRKRQKSKLREIWLGAGRNGAVVVDKEEIPSG